MAAKTPPDEIARLFSDLTFEKRLALIAEGFCPYCEVALGERAKVGTGMSARCPCCGGLLRTIDVPGVRKGSGWYSTQGHDCPHTSSWASDENPNRPRFEFREQRVFFRAGRQVVLPR